MITGDFHVHTSFSTDSDTAVREMLESAVKKGLEVVCITDHWDEDYPERYEKPEEKLFCFDLPEYFRELEALKEEYAGRLDVRIGIELGLQAHLGAFYKELVSKYPFDFVIGSVHLVKGTDPYFGELSQKYEDTQIYQSAFSETIQNLESVESFDVLGHIDYVVRYGKHQAKSYSYEQYREVLDEILMKVIVSGRGIEVNTAGWKYGLEFCHPHPDILKRYRELGGEILTIGSDGHRPEHVAYEFAKAEELLRECGFSYYTQFRNRKPVFQHL